MVGWARFLLVSFTLLSSVCFAQIGMIPSTRRDNTMTSQFANGGSPLAGMVVDALNNKPLQNVRVELHDINNGSAMGSVYTNSAGQFEFASVPQGLYRIIALQGVGQAEERVEVSAFRTTVILRVPLASEPAAGLGRNTISVAQYQVPEKARDEFVKAAQASEKNKIDEAKKHLEKALEIYPNYADALTLRAILNLAGNTSVAVTDLEKAIQSDGNYALAYTVLGSAFNSQSKFDEALKTLARGQTLSPDSWQSYFEMARAYLGKSDYQSALSQVEKAQSLVRVEYPPLRLVRAQVLLALKQYDRAMADCRAYLEKNPNGPNAVAAQQMLEQAKQLAKN
jgi:Carboxypeptidase regulatory-like domain/Tetratricopeptide repeat